MNYGVYDQIAWDYSERNGRNVNLKITFNLGYGKETRSTTPSVNKSIESALMTRD